MPHLKLEYSANVKSSDDLSELFSQFHHVLTDVGKISLQNCKSRAYAADTFLVGSGENTGFIHLDVRFLEGRSQDVIREIGVQLLEILKSWCATASKQPDLQITIEIQGIRKIEYFKFPGGTFSQQ